MVPNWAPSLGKMFFFATFLLFHTCYVFLAIKNDWMTCGGFTIPIKVFREQGWCSGESIRLPPMWLGFDSRTRRHMWVEFVVGSLLCSERFFSGCSGFRLSSKTNISKFQFDPDFSGRIATLWRCHLKFQLLKVFSFRSLQPTRKLLVFP